MSEMLGSLCQSEILLFRYSFRIYGVVFSMCWHFAEEEEEKENLLFSVGCVRKTQ